MRVLTPVRTLVPTLVPALVLTLAIATAFLAGCERSAGPPDAAGPAVSASDRDTSLEAIDRWLTAGQPESGEAIARVLLRRLPRDPHVRMALARTLVARAGRVQAAEGPDAARPLAGEAAAILAAEHRPSASAGFDLASWNRTRGLALETAGRDVEAIATYRETATEDRVAALYLALALLRVDETEEARTLLETLARSNASDPYVLAALAEARFDPAAPDDARTTIAQAVRLDPDAWPIRLRQATIERRAGHPDRAIEMLSALSAKTRDERVVCDELARAWRAYGDPGRAGDVWANRAAAHPEDRGAALEAANMYGEAGRLEEAEAWIRVVEDVDPGDRRIVEARRRLEAAVRDRVAPDAPDSPDSPDSPNSPNSP